MSERVSAADIKDEDTLKAWLEGRPREDALWIAHRAMLRALPLWGAAMDADWAWNRDLTTLTLLRCGMISAVAVIVPTADIRDIATGASATTSYALDDASDATAADPADAVASSAYYAARAAFDAARATNSSAAARAAAYAARAAPIEAATVWAAARADAEVLEAGEVPGKLWPGQVPGFFTKAETEMLRIWDTESAARWAFWRRWWAAAVAGQPLDPALQLAIVQGVDNETWENPDKTAARIAEIEAERTLDRLIAENPHAWRIAFDPKTGQFEAHAVETRDLSDVVADVRTAITDFNARCRKMKVANFGQAVQLAFQPVIDLLRKDLRRYGDSPLSLYKAIEYARAEMEEIAAVEQFAGESYLTRFFKTLDDHAENVCLSAPEVVEQLKAKSAVRFDLWTLERRQQMMQNTFGLHLDAEGILKRASLEALRVLQDDEADEDAKREAFYFCTAILPRAARAYLAEKEEAGAAPEPAEASRLKRAADAANALSTLDKGVDALQENIPEAYEFARRIIENVSIGGGF